MSDRADAVPRPRRRGSKVLLVLLMFGAIEFGLRRARPTVDIAELPSASLSLPIDGPNIAVLEDASSYALLDAVPRVLASKPAAVLVFAGHDEYYGTWGIIDAPSLVGSPMLARFLLRAQRIRLVALATSLFGAARRTLAPPSEAVEGEVPIGLRSPRYRNGVEQFGANLDAIVREVQDAGVPIIVATPASNLRDQQPFAEISHLPSRGATEAFATATSALEEAHAAMARADTARALHEREAARTTFIRARELDPLRYRAPSAFDSVAMAVAKRRHALFVDSQAALAAAAEDGIPGRDLFRDATHLTPRGAIALTRAVCAAGATIRAIAPACVNTASGAN
jgi:hypothetical protein